MKGKTDKKIRTIRVAIYTLGMIPIIIVSYVNFFKTQTKQSPFTQSYSDLQTIFVAPSKINFTETEIELFTEKNLNHSSIEVKTTKTIWAILEDQGKTITESEQLKEKLFFKNNSPYPNGSILKYKEKIYYLERGKLRPFSSDKTFKAMGFDFNKLSVIQKKEFKEFEIGKVIKNELDPEKYPKDLIIKSGNQFFIEDVRDVYPIFSEKLISETWENFSFIETESISRKDLHSMKCFSQENTTVICKLNFEQKLRNIPGNAYVFYVYGVPLNSIKTASVKLTKKVTLKEGFKKMWLTLSEK